MNFISNLTIIGMIFISGVLASGYWFFLYDPGLDIIQETENVKNQIIQTDKNIKKKKEEIEKAVAFDNSVRLLGQELELFYEYFPYQLTNRQLFQDLTRLSKDSGLEIMSMKGSSRQKQTELYETLNVQLVIEGEFAQFLSFLSKLTDLDKVITVQNVDIKPVAVGNRNESGDVKIQKIQAQINVLGFRYIQPATVQDENAKQNEQT
ncbi:MAG: type 4a pilus biogenesis protein PilO [Bdellovibrionales bacterium]|nr:type 4a pilus biogenesis protein PilO [Bdellovibrionales bacterium]